MWPFPNLIRLLLKRSLRVNIGGLKDIPLAELLETSETAAFLVIKDDVVVFENYYGGYDRTTSSLSFSMAKSVLSLLVGCALDDGYLQSVDQPVTDFVPELAEKGFSIVTLRHLLQMTSGIDYAENDFPFGLHVRFYYTDRLEDEILKLRLQEPPGRGGLFTDPAMPSCCRLHLTAPWATRPSPNIRKGESGIRWAWSTMGPGASIMRRTDWRRPAAASPQPRGTSPRSDAYT